MEVTEVSIFCLGANTLLEAAQIGRLSQRLVITEEMLLARSTDLLIDQNFLPHVVSNFCVFDKS